MSTSHNDEDTPHNPAIANEQGQQRDPEVEEGTAEADTAQTAASLNGSGASDDFPGNAGDSSGIFEGQNLRCLLVCRIMDTLE